MKSLPQPWTKLTDDTEREFQASQSLEMAVQLTESDGWKAMTAAINDQVHATLKDLARSSKDDEQNRGVLRALDHVLSMPGELARAASKELEQHR